MQKVVQRTVSYPVPIYVFPLRAYTKHEVTYPTCKTRLGGWGGGGGGERMGGQGGGGVRHFDWWGAMRKGARWKLAVGVGVGVGGLCVRFVLYTCISLSFILLRIILLQSAT